MKVWFNTLADQKYSVRLERYQAKPFKKVASDFQFKWKRFFMNQFPKDFWAEEFPCRPLFSHRYRLDLVNWTKKLVIEAHGAQHTAVSDYFHGGSWDKFGEALIKDREKELWCEHNGLHVILVYESTPMNLDFFIKRYPEVKWK